MRLPLRPLLLAAFAPALAAQPSIDQPTLFPAGARASGVPAVTFDSGANAYAFKLLDPAGTVLVDYRLPLAHTHVQNGLLRIEEASTGIVPVAAGGLFYRTAGVPASGLGRLITPYELAFGATHASNHTATLLGHTLDAARLEVRLRFADCRAASSARCCSRPIPPTTPRAARETRRVTSRMAGTPTSTSRAPISQVWAIPTTSSAATTTPRTSPATRRRSTVRSGFPVGRAHIDAQTELPAWIHVDQIAGSGLPKTIADGLRNREVAFQTTKDAMDGPLLGENSHWRSRAFETFAAGVLDGTSRKIPIHWSPAQGRRDQQLLELA